MMAAAYSLTCCPSTLVPENKFSHNPNDTSSFFVFSVLRNLRILVNELGFNHRTEPFSAQRSVVVVLDTADGITTVE